MPHSKDAASSFVLALSRKPYRPPNIHLGVGRGSLAIGVMLNQRISAAGNYAKDFRRKRSGNMLTLYVDA
jgi:hypothetical protein